MAFQAAYAVGMLSVGGILDRVGTKIGYTVAVVLWSLAAMFHAVGQSIVSFATLRFLLGVGQSAHFPAAIKTVTEWFPKKERALASGIFNSGSNVGAIITPLLVPIIAANYGWQWAFIITGALGFIWLLFWIPIYKRPEINEHLSDAEREYILQDGADSTEKIPWRKIFPHKQTLGICIARFLTDPIWWFFLFWLPKFLGTRFGIDLIHIGWPLVIIYTVSIGGSLVGGWLSAYFIGQGKTPLAARKKSILLLAFLVIPIFFAAITTHVWIAVALISLAAFAHQGYAANIYTVVSDIYPKNAVGSMAGLAGFSGAVGGVLFSGAIGLILQLTGSYYVVFGIASVAYLLCWTSLKLFVPDDKEVKIN
jgi:MFS transporter, ACS family, hexuronate transporter